MKSLLLKTILGHTKMSCLFSLKQIHYMMTADAITFSQSPRAHNKIKSKPDLF